MNILLTNDDGYLADGFQALYKKLKGEYSLYVCAPTTQKSSVSHAVSLFKPLKYIEVDDGFAVDGTPSDCIKIALHGFFKETKFDLIVSGINNGINMGHDIYYSGTVAGAREAEMNNISGIACSKNWDGKYKEFSTSADFMLSFIRKSEKLIKKEKVFLNINFPAVKEFKGAKLTHLGNRIYNNTIYFEEKNNEKFVSIVGDALKFDKDEGSDLDCVSENYVSITPLSGTKACYDPRLNEEISSCITSI